MSGWSVVRWTGVLGLASIVVQLVGFIFGFAGQIVVLALFYHFETFVAFGTSLYVKELFTIGSSWYSVPVSWLGIIGVIVPVISIGYAYAIRAQNPEKYALMGRFVNESI